MTDHLTCFLLGVFTGSVVGLGLPVLVFLTDWRRMRRPSTTYLRDQND